jgi:hypothetical protein
MRTKADGTPASAATVNTSIAAVPRSALWWTIWWPMAKDKQGDVDVR